jgi:signal transduction histidine kinase
MHKFLCCIVFLCSTQRIIAQDHFTADSLLKAADSEKTDTGRMKLYNKLANYYMGNNASKAIEYFEKSKTIATAKGLDLKMANNFYSIGYCYLLKADFEKSLYNYLQSIKVYEKLKDSFRLSNALMSIGNVYFQSKDRKKTNEYYDKSEKLIVAMNDSQQLASVYDTRGIMYDQLGLFDSALVYAYKAYHIARLLNDQDFAMNILSNIGLNYKHQFKTLQALNCFDSVLTHYRKTDAPADRIGALYNNIAATQAQAGNYVQALEAFEKSIAYAKQTGSPTIEMENYRNMADMFAEKKDYAQQANYLTKYHHLKDSIFTLESKNQLTGLEADYQLEKKNIELVKQEAELVKQKSQRNIFIIIALAAAMIIAAGSFFYSRIRRNNKALTEKNILISEQKNELQTLNHVKDRLFSIISHDLRNPLATLRSYLSLADNDALAPEKKLQFKIQTMNAVINTGDMLDNLLAWANVQIKNTNPPIVPINIADCVWDTVHHAEAQAFQKQITIVQEVNAATALGDYDIISIALRNLVTNAIKYSDAGKSIYIISSAAGERVTLTVKDEGTGLTTRQIEQILSNENSSTAGTQGEKGSGLGLFLVKELLQKINAQLKIESEVGKGSSFSIVMDGV